MKRIILILCLLPCLAIAGTKRVPVTMDPDTGLIYPRTSNGHVPDLPGGTTKGGSAIGGGGGSGTVTALTSTTGLTGLTISITNPTTTPVLSIGGSLLWSSITKSGSNLSDLAIRNFASLQNKPTTLAGYGITDALTAAGPLNFAGFSSLTGRITNANLPINAQLFDNTGHRAFDAGNRAGYQTNGTTPAYFWTDTGIYVTGTLSATGFNGAILDFDPAGDGLQLFSVNNYRIFYFDTGVDTGTPELKIGSIPSGKISIGKDMDGDYADVVWGSIVTDLLTADRLWHGPNAAGTFALTTDSTGISDLTHGGTGATTAAAARANLDAAPLHRTTNVQTGTSYTLLLTDDGKFVSRNNASANTVTVPTHASVPFQTNAIIPIQQKGAGTTTIVPAGGVTIHSRGGLLSLAGQYSGAALTYEGSDVWLLVGDLQ